MGQANPSPGAQMLSSWRRLKWLPFGKRLYSWSVGRGAPYTGTVGARIVHLEPGHSRVTLRDRRKVRNHLDSVHAVALVNLGEVTSGIAMLTALAPGVRGIVKKLECEYLKKARGRLTAETRCDPPSEVSEPQEYEVTAEIRDASGDLVAELTATWLLGPPRG